MTKVKTPTGKSDLSNWVNAPEFVSKTINVHIEDRSLHSPRKDKMSTFGPDLLNWVHAPEFLPKTINSQVKDHNLDSLRIVQKSTCSPVLPNWINAPEFVPINNNLRAKVRHHHSSRKDKVSKLSPDSLNWINASEFVPSNTNLLAKDQSIHHFMIKDKISTCGPESTNWVNAPEFVPKNKKSFADTLKPIACGTTKLKQQKLDMELCIHFFEGKCLYNEECPCIHGDLCELCRKYCLNPFDEKKRKYHIEYCEKELELDMELSFAIQRSLDKTCGICMDVIMEKDPAGERRFGILEKCNHVFCLSCIRKWRSVKTFESVQHVNHLLNPAVNRACPECRVSSGFITPSRYWVDTEEEKKKLIADYKMALGKKPCKYFKRGKGTCPFGGACFYLHAKPDGTKVDLPQPSRRRRQNQNGEIDFMNTVTLWDYLEVRDTFVSR